MKSYQVIKNRIKKVSCLLRTIKYTSLHVCYTVYSRICLYWKVLLVLLVTISHIIWCDPPLKFGHSTHISRKNTIKRLIYTLKYEKQSCIMKHVSKIPLISRYMGIPLCDYLDFYWLSVIYKIMSEDPQNPKKFLTCSLLPIFNRKIVSKHKIFINKICVKFNCALNSAKII
jgi:hypothetical protein